MYQLKMYHCIKTRFFQQWSSAFCLRSLYIRAQRNVT